MPQGPRNYIVNRNTMAVGAGSPSSIIVPALPGIVHRSDWLVTKDVAGTATPLSKADMLLYVEKLQIQVGSGIFGDYLTSDILRMNEFYGYNYVDGRLQQFFTQDWRETAYDAQRTAFVPGAHRDPTFRLFLKSGISAPTVVNKLLVEGVGDANRLSIASDPTAAVREIVRYGVETLKLTDTGNTPTEIRHDIRAKAVRSLNFEGAHITGITIKINGVEKFVYDSLDALNEDLKQSRAAAVPQADTWHINFELLGNSVDASYQPQYAGFAPDEIDIEIYASSTANVRLFSEFYDRPKSRVEA